jgi:hypothetical protein
MDFLPTQRLSPFADITLMAGLETPRDDHLSNHFDPPQDRSDGGRLGPLRGVISVIRNS